MKFKLIIITLFLLFILMIGNVSATSNTTDTINSDLTDTAYSINSDIPSTDPNQFDDKNQVNANNIQKTQIKSVNEEIYVNKSSESTIEDGTKTNPYKTITEEIINGLKSDTTINIANGNYELNTINLNNHITIIGQNKEETILHTNSENGLFNINSNSRLKLVNLTIRDYTSTTSVAINNNGQLTIENLFLQNASRNVATGKGGFIYSTNNLTIIDCIFDDNKASYGACIYTNKGQTIIINSTFTNSEILNVGGAIYCLNSKTEIYDSKFMYNRAVSGAAVYNAFGNLSVNNTYFFGNNAQHFFGGAIYNTGRTIVNNSNFIENHATIDGGAITNTNYFYSINCNYTSNWADKNGGVIENIPVNESERGTLIILNNSFSKNSAENGGVIINYKYGTSILGTITITNASFIENNADKGGIIYNEGIIHMEDSTLRNNTAEEGNIYMHYGNLNISNSDIEYNEIYCSSDDFKVELIDSTHIIIKDDRYHPPNNITNSSKDTPIPDSTPKTNKKTSQKVTKIIANKKTFKRKIKIKKYTITLKYGKKGVPQAHIYLTIKGKKYKKTFKAQTNNKGKAIFKIKNLKRKGKYKATIIYKGNKNYKKSTRTLQITIK